MKRNLTITTNITDNSQNKISIQDLPSAVNHSVDLIFCDILENIEEKNIGQFIQNVLMKIRPSGYIVFKFLDVKKICNDFIQNSISNSDFIEYFNKKQGIVTLDLLYTFFDTKQFDITKLEKDKDYISLTINRKSV
jgi:predicted SAM-dependent methyltransferase